MTSPVATSSLKTFRTRGLPRCLGWVSFVLVTLAVPAPRALAQLDQGTYGHCESCNSKILIARLNALPYSTLCIKCQRESENDDNFLADHGIVGWEGVRDGREDREFNVSDLEAEIRN